MLRLPDAISEQPTGCRYPNPRDRARRRSKRAGEQAWRREYRTTGDVTTPARAAR